MLHAQRAVSMPETIGFTFVGRRLDADGGAGEYCSRGPAPRLARQTSKTKMEQQTERIEAEAEVRRELSLRILIYPRLIANGKLTPEEAAHRIKALRHALAVLERAGHATS